MLTVAKGQRSTKAARALLSGWGGTSPSAAELVEASDEESLQALLEGAGPRGVIARGLGRSYGDAAQNAGGTVVRALSMNRLLDLDLERGTVRAQAGLSLDRLMRLVVPLGWWPTVTPGTRQVTVGGAIASDVHGKNHHRDGTFGASVESLVLHTPAEGRMVVGPKDSPEIFWATTGGMGLTGLVSEATFRLTPIETSQMRVLAERAPDLDAAMSRMAEADSKWRYSVAWVDCLARGRSLGRSVLEFGEHARLDELPQKQQAAERALRFDPPRGLAAPPWAPSGLLNRYSVGAFNELWYRKAPRRPTEHLVKAPAFFHPLDAVANWNHIYGSAGFVQYQMVVPDEAGWAVRKAVEAFSDARCASFLAVLKRFGSSNPGPLSFPRTGWTLALDIPARAKGLAGMLDSLDEMVAEAGGRVYLAKDSRLRPELLEIMYPQLTRWREVRERLDPKRTLVSDLARRLPGLLEPPGGATTRDSKL